MPLVITTCTNRKRKPISEALHASSLPRAVIEEVMAEWVHRLSDEKARFPVTDLYGGRSFQDAAVTAEVLGGRMLVISAGLGVLDARAVVPSYACTILPHVADSLSARVAGLFSVQEWWVLLTQASPFSFRLDQAITASKGLVCAALSGAYIEMIAGDLVALPASARDRLRLFTRASLDRVPKLLRPYVMPYDDRLDGIDSTIRGTRNDFAGRALRHFAENIVLPTDERSVEKHAAAVQAALAKWRLPVTVARQRHDDSTLLALLHQHWERNGGSTARLLRFFRDDLNIACEQGRFAVLARMVRKGEA